MLPVDVHGDRRRNLGPLVHRSSVARLALIAPLKPSFCKAACSVRAAASVVHRLPTGP